MLAIADIAWRKGIRPETADRGFGMGRPSSHLVIRFRRTRPVADGPHTVSSRRHGRAVGGQPI